MQLASHGARATNRNASKLLPRTPGASFASRSIHIPSIKPRIAVHGTQKFVAQTRTLLSRFFAHLTAPGLNASLVPSYARSLHGRAPGNMSSIQSRLSFPVRAKLGRPAPSQFFPRAPTMAPTRSVTQLGLGSARNFSSGRSVFQNLVENVPIAGRSFYEADWEINALKGREAMKKSMKSEKKRSSRVGKAVMKPVFVKETIAPVAEQTTAEEIEHYFPAPANSGSTTYLLIPLAPTPTSRVPLPVDTDPHASLLPISTLASMHNSHERHSLRVSSLFLRLDGANVWERGVQCSAYAQRAGPEGVCTILKVEFVGWSMAEVRSVIGESGTGWCVLEEVQAQDANEEDDVLSDTSSVFSGMSGGYEEGMEAQSTTQSFVLPTLDFSSSFHNASSTSLSSTLTSSQPSFDSTDLLADSTSDLDGWSDSSDISSEGWVEAPSANGWFGFSSDFARRVGEGAQSQYEPSETAFY